MHSVTKFDLLYNVCSSPHMPSSFTEVPSIMGKHAILLLQLCFDLFYIHTYTTNKIHRTECFNYIIIEVTLLVCPINHCSYVN